ncbi:MAG: hypothetical protein DMG30_18020 [Acidobacteria bacterium]|nr:MAG: hypothetical protein DMG30_18020 [Acidobacteriota bacterium]
MCHSGQFRRLAGLRESDSHTIAARQEQLPARLSQRGNSRLKLILFLAVALAMIYLGVKVIPILVNNAQFQDAIESTARFASVNRQSPEDIRAAVLKQAQEVDIPITAKDIQVRGESGHVEIAADYSVTVDLGVYQWTLNFHPYAKNNPLL